MEKRDYCPREEPLVPLSPAAPQPQAWHWGLHVAAMVLLLDSARILESLHSNKLGVSLWASQKGNTDSKLASNALSISAEAALWHSCTSGGRATCFLLVPTGCQALTTRESLGAKIHFVLVCQCFNTCNLKFKILFYKHYCNFSETELCA